MAFSSPSNDQRNFECVTVASVDFIKLPLKDILESLIQPVDLYKGIKSCPALLSGKYKLRQDQLKLCVPQPKAIPDYSKFDVTLLYTLIRNLCPSLKPTKEWGKDPDDTDIQIGDDIERLRLFRNNYHAHADSAAISDADFKDIWKNLNSVVNRIQKYTYKKGHNVDYEQELRKIESSKIAKDHLESCKLLLEALMNIQKQTEEKDEPEIFLKGEDRVICGGTARLEANPRNVDFSCWQFTWQKRIGNSIECIDTNQEKYKGSTNTILLIQNVSKEDEGEYQAVLSREANGIEYKISSKTVYLHALGGKSIVSYNESNLHGRTNNRIYYMFLLFYYFDTERPSLNDLRVTTGDEGITIHYSYKVLEQSPEVKYIHWCKNGEPLERKSEKYIGGSLNENCFTITSPTDEDRGKYSCTITNAVGSVSKAVILGLPNITTSEETVQRNKLVKLVGNVFVYDGSPDILEVFWTKNGDKIDTQGSGGRLSTVTVDDPSLTIRDVSHIDAGEYKLIARNAVGTTSSDTIAIGTPNVHLERLKNEGSGSQCFRATIKGTPSPCSAQWSKKGNDEDEFKPIDADAEEFRGTTNYLPHPELVVKGINLLENNFFQIEVSNFVGNTIEKISDNRYQAELVCNFISPLGGQRVLLDFCLDILIRSLKNPDNPWKKDEIVKHVREMISKLVEDNEKDRLEYFCQNLYQDESLSDTLLKCGEDFYALIFSMEKKYNARNIMLSEGSFCVTFCFENKLHLENYLKKLESKNEELIIDLSKLTLNKTLLKIFSINPQQIWWAAWTVKVYKGTQYFEKMFTYPIESFSEDCFATEPEDPVENPETLKQKFHQMSLKTSDKFETLTKDVEKSQTKQEKLLSQTQGMDKLTMEGLIKELQILFTEGDMKSVVKIISDLTGTDVANVFQKLSCGVNILSKLTGSSTIPVSSFTVSLSALSSMFKKIASNLKSFAPPAEEDSIFVTLLRYQDSELKAEAVYVIDLLFSINAYLGEIDEQAHESVVYRLEDRLPTNDIVRFMGKLKAKTYELLTTSDPHSGRRASVYINLYFRLAILRTLVLWQIFCIKQRSNYDQPSTQGVLVMINEGKKSDLEVVSYVTETSFRKVVFHTMFHPTENENFMHFLSIHGIRIPSFGHDKGLCRRAHFIRSSKMPDIKLEMMSPKTDNIRGSQNTSFACKFYLEPVRNRKMDGIFYMRSVKWSDSYVSMDKDGKCVSVSGKPGSEGQWKVVRLGNEGLLPQFLFSTLKWPCKFLFMKSCWRTFFIEGTENFKAFKEACLWEILDV